MVLPTLTSRTARGLQRSAPRGAQRTRSDYEREQEHEHDSISCFPAFLIRPSYFLASRSRLGMTPSNNKKLFSPRDLSERLALMDSLYFLADAKVFGIAFNAWKIIGLSGSIIFGLRFLVQWIASERARKSVIPFGFWECSAVGSLLLLAYFGLYRHDSVGVLQSALPLPIYLRNLYFRYTHHEPKHAGAEPRSEE